MAEKKPNIDLKARLGRKTITAQGGPSIPPPVGIPKPSLPPVPGMGPMGGPASDPYAPPPAPPQPQTLKIEMSEEVIAAQKKGKKRTLIFIGIAAAVGIGVGSVIGSQVEAGKKYDQAAQGASELTTEVKEANSVANTLKETLGEMNAKLSAGQFPQEAVAKLGELNIPFDGTNLEGKGIGVLAGSTQRLLFGYAGASQEVNDKKSRLMSVMTSGKKSLTEYFDQSKEPKVRWITFLSNGPSGPWATMRRAPAPFAVKADATKPWPKEFELKEGNQTVKLGRYETGNPIAETPMAIPVDPTSENVVCADTVALKLRAEIVQLQKALDGDETPGSEKAGLIKTGDDLLEKLKTVGL